MSRRTMVPTSFAAMMAAVVLAGVASGWAVGALTTEDRPTTTASVPVRTTVTPAVFLSRRVLVECTVVREFPPPQDVGAPTALGSSVPTTVAGGWAQFIHGTDSELNDAITRAVPSTKSNGSSRPTSLNPDRQAGVFVVAIDKSASWVGEYTKQPRSLVVLYEYADVAKGDTGPANVLVRIDPSLKTKGLKDLLESLVTDLIKRGTPACAGP